MFMANITAIEEKRKPVSYSKTLYLFIEGESNFMSPFMSFFIQQ